MGPIRMGMKTDAVKRACAGNDVTVKETSVMNEGEKSPALAISHKNDLLVLVELPDPDRSVWRVEVLDRRLKTPQGVGPGSTVQELARHYGVGKVLGSEGLVYSVFDKKGPGRSFGMAGLSKLAEVGLTWKNLLKANQKVVHILVVGEE